MRKRNNRVSGLNEGTDIRSKCLEQGPTTEKLLKVLKTRKHHPAPSTSLMSLQPPGVSQIPPSPPPWSLQVPSTFPSPHCHHHGTINSRGLCGAKSRGNHPRNKSMSKTPASQSRDWFRTITKDRMTYPGILPKSQNLGKAYHLSLPPCPPPYLYKLLFMVIILWLWSLWGLLSSLSGFCLTLSLSNPSVEHASHPKWPDVASKIPDGYLEHSCH